MKVFLFSLMASVLVTLAGILAYHFLITNNKVGYVKTGVILQKYQAMTDANKQFESELKIVRSNVDTLRARYENLKLREASVPRSEKADWGYQLGVAEKEFLQYSETADRQLQERQQQLTVDVLNKVNGYIQKYGEENGFKLILGTTNEGSILYGEADDDLTDEILIELNKQYSSKTISQAE